jgi:trimethylamine-N-oxide reductase (cytochrome c)
MFIQNRKSGNQDDLSVGGSFIGTMTETTRWARMYQSPKIEFVVNQDCWWNTETRFADVILTGLYQFRKE